MDKSTQLLKEMTDLCKTQRDHMMQLTVENLNLANSIASVETINNLLIDTLMYYADKTIYTDGDVPMHVYALDDSGSIARKALGFTESDADHVEIRNRRFASEG